MALSVVQIKAITDSLSGSFTTATTAGNTVVVIVVTSTSAAPSVSGVTLGGSAGNFGNGITKTFGSGTAQGIASIWVDPNCAGGQTAIAVTGTNLNIAGDNGIVIMEIAGVAAGSTVAAVLDKTAVATGSTTSPTTGTTATTTQAAEIFIGAIAGGDHLSAFTSGWTSTTLDDGGGIFNAVGYKIVSATSAAVFGCTQATASLWGGAILTLLAATTTTHSGTATLSGTGSMTAAGAFAGSAPLAGVGTMSATWQLAGSAPLAGMGTMTALGSAGDASLMAGVGSLSATPTFTFAETLALAGTGSMTDAGALSGSPAALAGVGSMSENLTLKLLVGLSGSGSLSVPQVSGGLVNGVGGVGFAYALPGSTMVAVAPPGSSNWQFLETLGQKTALTYSFACPGGCDKLSVTLMIPASYRSQLLSPGWQVRATRGGHTVWTGKMDEPQYTAQGCTVTAVGTGNRGQDFTAQYSSTWPSGEPDQAVNNAISRGLPWINPGVGSPSGAWFGQGVDSGAQTITALLTLICTRGGLTWYVNSQPGGPIGDSLSVFPLPTAVNRLLVVTTPVSRTLGGDINTIVIRYMATADNTTTGVPATYALTTVQNAASVAAHQVIETYIDLSDVGQQSSGAAQAVGNAVLSIYQRASFAGPFQASHGQLLNAGGAPVDPGTDQAGNVVKLILTDFGYGGEVVPGPITFIVGMYEWDDFKQVATITPYQNLDQSLTGLLSAQNTVMVPIKAASGP
jgi:hypothetical protein